jgi:zona occludens toxin
MITVTTGLPGHGKTLYTIELVEKLRVETGRPVYYKRKESVDDYGIEGLTLDWLPMPDPQKWYELPAGSIIVIDECQRLFVKRSQTSAPPPYVSKLETHRHNGHDLFLITQDAKNIDHHARRLIEVHRHTQRLYGTQKRRIYTWQKCRDPDRKADLAEAQTELGRLNPKFFGVYKSAEVHTVKRRLPWKWIAAAVVGLVVMPLLAFRVVSWFTGETRDMTRRAAGQEVESGVPQNGAATDTRPPTSSWATERFVPRVASWPWSAPFYDEGTKERNPPRVIGCLSIELPTRTICKCSNGQGDAGVPQAVCFQYIAGMHYDPLRRTEDLKAHNVAYLEARASSAPAAGETTTSGSAITARSGSL